MISVSDITLTHKRAGVWLVDEPIVFEDGLMRLTVPAGFETDLASVPRALWSVFPPYGDHLKAAVVHDYLYRYNTISRARCDAIFLAVMARYGVPAWKRWCMYGAVRLFGGPAYRR